MSAVNSTSAAPTVTQEGATEGQSNYDLQVVGAVYRDNPNLVNDTKAQSVRIEADGTVRTHDVNVDGKLQDVNTNLGTIQTRIGALTEAAPANSAASSGLNGLIRFLINSITSLIGATNTALSTIDGRVDGLETLVGTTNSTLTTIDGRVDGLEALIGSTNTKLDTVNTNLGTIDGRVDGLETLITSTNTKLDSLITSNAANLNGTQTTGTVGTSASTLSAPSNAVGFILQASSANSSNLRYRIGATATTTTGQQLEPGRDSGFIPCGANVSVISESGTNEYQIQWIQR